MRFSPLITSVVTFAIVGSSMMCGGKVPLENNTFWVWEQDGALRSLAEGAVFQAKGGRIEWPVVNGTTQPVVASVRITHCNGQTFFNDDTCPFGRLKNDSCRTEAVDVKAWGSLPGGTVVGTLSGSCPVPFRESPIEWLRGRHRWNFAFDAAYAGGAPSSMDPELQIDGGGPLINLLKVLAIALGAAGLHILARRLLRAFA